MEWDGLAWDVACDGVGKEMAGGVGRGAKGVGRGMQDGMIRDRNCGTGNEKENEKEDDNGKGGAQLKRRGRVG